MTDLLDDYYSGVLTIPPGVTYDGKNYTVTSIGEYALASSYYITSVKLPNTIESIQADIFKRIPYLAPTRPLCMFSTLHGFILPLKSVLEAHNALDEKWRENVSIIMSFFKVGGKAYSIQSGL